MQIIYFFFVLAGFFGDVDLAVAAPVLNPYYGKTSQLDPELQSYRLTKRDDSFLCAPTVVVNALEKLRNDYGMISPFPSGAYEIADIVTRIAPLTGVRSTDFVSQGIEITKIKTILDYKLKKEKFPLQTRLSSAPSLNIEDFQRAVLPGYSTLAFVFYYDDKGARIMDLEEPFAGHALTVIGYDDEDPQRIYLSDPYRPLDVRGARLVMHTDKVGAQTRLQIIFDGGSSSVIYLVRFALLISPKTH